MKTNRKTMLDLPAEERPYEKCIAFGPESLSDAELLAVLLRTGTRGKTALELAQEILSGTGIHYGLTGIFHLSAEDLQNIPGVGRVKAVQIRCLTELTRPTAKAAAKKRLTV